MRLRRIASSQTGAPSLVTFSQRPRRCLAESSRVCRTLRPLSYQRSPIHLTAFGQALRTVPAHLRTGETLGLTNPEYRLLHQSQVTKVHVPLLRCFDNPSRERF